LLNSWQQQGISVNDATEFTTVVFDVDGTLIDSNGAHARGTFST
jgi:hypothetical protein